MIHTQSSDDIQDYLAFLNQCPDARATLENARGATSEDIERFSSLVRYPLPEIYKGYLMHFGVSDRGLDLADDGFSKIGELIEFYEDQIPVGYWDVPILGTVVALQALTGGRALLYDDELTEEPQVAVNWGDTVSHVIAESARNWLYQTAYSRFRVRTSDIVPEFLSFNIPGDGRPILAKLGKMCDASDLARLWFADSYVHCAERSDLRVCIFADPSHVAVTMCGTREVCTTFAAKIRRDFDVPVVTR
jgi:hypothetical protein